MIELFGILWLRPGWLALLPLAVAAAILLARRAGRLGAWEGVLDAPMLAAMRQLGRVVPGRRALSIAPAALIALLGIALAGPASERRQTESYRNLDAVVLVLDLSPSVVESGRLFDMLTAARLLAEAAGTRQTAVVIYAGEAYVAAPLSSDARALMGTLALLDGETMPIGGSRPEAGLALARQMLAEAHILAADVVLIGDGGAVGAEALAETKALLGAGAHLSTLALGADGAALDALSQSGGGVAGTIDQPFAVARQLSERPVTRLARTGFAVLVVEDLGRWLLLLALVPAAFLLPRRSPS